MEVDTEDNPALVIDVDTEKPLRRQRYRFFTFKNLLYSFVDKRSNGDDEVASLLLLCPSHLQGQAVSLCGLGDLSTVTVFEQRIFASGQCAGTVEDVLAIMLEVMLLNLCLR